MIYKAVANVPPTYLTAALGTIGFLLKQIEVIVFFRFILTIWFWRKFPEINCCIYFANSVTSIINE